MVPVQSPSVEDGGVHPVVEKVLIAVPTTGTLAIAVVTNAVVAICVVLVPGDAVGAAGTPVKVGDAKGAAPLT